MTKHSAKNTNAPYTFKRGDAVKFKAERDFNPNALGIIVLAAGEQGMLRNTLAVWCGEFTDSGKFLLHEVSDIDVKLFNLIDNMKYMD